MSIAKRLLSQFRSLRRFPVPIAIALLLTIVANLDIALLSTLQPFEAEAIFALVGALFAALIADLATESRGLSKRARLAGAIGAAATIAALQLAHGKLYDQSLVVVGALVLSLMTAGRFRRGANNGALWKFNLGLGIAVGMGLLAFLIVSLGISFLVKSAQYLFEIHFPDRLLVHIWVTDAALVAPLFALATIPGEADQSFVPHSEPAMLERAVAAVLDFALAPLVLAYALMLHVYAAKIAVTASMPKGEIGSLVLAFGAVGTITFLIAYPWRAVGSRPVRWLSAGWFGLMIVPTLLLVIAVWKRIDQYGVTPERYGLCLFALWLVAMAAYLGFMRGRIDLRTIPASLGAALLLSSFGPWGATAVSTRSQMHQLYEVLAEHHLLADDQLQLTPPRLATLNKTMVSNSQLLSIFKELDSLDALDRTAPLFAAIEDNPFKRKMADADLEHALALDRWPDVKPAPSSIPAEFDIGSYDKMLGPMWIGPTGINIDGPNEPEIAQTQIAGEDLALAGTVLTVADKKASATFDISAARAFADGKSPDRPLLLPAREGADRAMLLISRASAPWSERRETWVLLNSR